MNFNSAANTIFHQFQDRASCPLHDLLIALDLDADWTRNSRTVLVEDRSPIYILDLLS